MPIEREPKRIVTTLLFLIVLQAAFMDYWSYSRAYHQNPDSFMDVLHHTATAPAQYRIGVMAPAGFLMKHLHLGLRHVLTVVDATMGLLAVFCLRSLLERSTTYRTAGLTSKWLAMAVLLLLFQFYLPWITWYQRPETMTTLAFVALSLFLLTVQPPIGGIWLTVSLQVGLVLMQSFVRADVPVAFYAGVFLACLTSRGIGMSLSRPIAITVSTLAILMAAGVQCYLARVVFPYATYGDTPAFQLLWQFKEPSRLLAFSLFIPPYLWLIGALVRRRSKLEGPTAAIVFASAIFMGMWWMVGRVEEVRIFLPFAMAVVPLTAQIAVERLAVTREDYS